MLLPGKIAGQSVYLLDDTDIEIVILVSRIFAISAARYRRVDCARMTFVYIYFFNTICRLFKFTKRDMTFAF